MYAKYVFFFLQIIGINNNNYNNYKNNIIKPTNLGILLKLKIHYDEIFSDLSKFAMLNSGVG